MLASNLLALEILPTFLIHLRVAAKTTKQLRSDILSVICQHKVISQIYDSKNNFELVIKLMKGLARGVYLLWLR